MPFEPLETDEVVAGGVKVKSMDDMMLFGCTGFVMASVLSYLLAVWPHIVFPAIDRLDTLLLCLLLGAVPTAILGIFASLRYGLAGACGYVGGSMAMAVFLFLRFEAAFIGAATKQVREPDYPPAMKYAVPLAWILLSVAVSYGFVRLHNRKQGD
jgi:hypothetical protein